MYTAQHGKPRIRTLLSRHTGVHTAPNAAARTARRSVPVVAIAGAVMGASPAWASEHYTVRPGDTLSAIAQQQYGTAGEWPAIAAANTSLIRDPDLIYPGQVITLPGAAAPAASPAPVHAVPAVPAAVVQRAAVIAGAGLSGHLGCSGLERLWEDAGGPGGAAETAASVAMAESGGNQYAQSPTWDFGYWQIHGTWGPAMATFDPWGNARAAIRISAGGTNWDAWTTYTSGAAAGRC